MKELQERLGYQFKNIELLQRALTHKSYANELNRNCEHNEKLEFLGDAVVDLVAGEYLFQRFPQDNEGGLSKKRASIVNEEILANLARGIGLSSLLLLGKGEMQSGGAEKPRLLASTLEALVGAMYLDGGFAGVREFLKLEFENIVGQICGDEDFERDYKTRLQEIMQKAFKVTPSYEVLAEEGPAHERTFMVCVKIGGEVLAQGRGRSKKSAEQMAARSAIEMRFKETP